jgi:amidohydrolase
LAAVITGVPAALSRRVDPRAALSLVWGAVSAGTAANAVPRRGVARGTVRTLDRRAWEQAPALITELAQGIGAAYGATVDVRYLRGVPPVVNDQVAVALLEAAASLVLGPEGVVDTPQSLGGEDFGWVGEKVPAAMARLGTRTPGGRTHDLHQAAFDVDEKCLAVGVGLLTEAARSYLA